MALSDIDTILQENSSVSVSDLTPEQEGNAVTMTFSDISVSTMNHIQPFLKGCDCGGCGKQ